MTTDILLTQAESALTDRDFSSLLPFALELEPHDPVFGREIYDFFTRLTRAILNCGEFHIPLFARCLDAVCERDEGMAFLRDMLSYADGLTAASSQLSVGILH